ncbi:hypothetical protein OPV22_003352 [Ensete ventricosum]|uniref:Uncharacterized protein n=1 Tax=Ensete ventricosum TaxID=4639 RepID=A0AAV8S0L3_ENSVE|nr:hypothetical protein OPV22_003352 [Ensete ventricosum]
MGCTGAGSSFLLPYSLEKLEEKMSQNCQTLTLAVETPLTASNGAHSLLSPSGKHFGLPAILRVSSSHTKLILCSLSGQWPASICTFQLRCKRSIVLWRQWKKTRGMAQSLVHLRHGCHLSPDSGFSTHGVEGDLRHNLS